MASTAAGVVFVEEADEAFRKELGGVLEGVAVELMSSEQKHALCEHLMMAARLVALSQALTRYTADFHGKHCTAREGGFSPLAHASKGSRLDACYHNILFMGMPARGTMAEFPSKYKGRMDSLLCAQIQGPSLRTLTSGRLDFDQCDVHYNPERIVASLPTFSCMIASQVAELYMPLTGDENKDVPILLGLGLSARRILHSATEFAAKDKHSNPKRLAAVTRRLSRALASV